mgnify:CR=1 FL=1
MDKVKQSRNYKSWADLTGVLLFMASLLVSLALKHVAGINVDIIITISILSMAWVYGSRAGIIACFLGVLVHITSELLLGQELQVLLAVNNIPGLIILIVITLAAGTTRQNSLRLKQSETELKALYNATSRLFHANDILSLGEQITATVAQDFKQVDCGILLIKPGSNQILRLSRAGIYNSNPAQPLYSDGTGLIPEAIRNVKMIYAPDVTKDQRYIANVSTTRSELVIPLRSSTGVIGALDLQSPLINAFDETTRRMLDKYAERAAAAIEMQLLHDELYGSVGELEWRVLQRTAELQGTKEQIEAILNNSSNSILLICPRGNIQRANPAFTDLSGYAKHQTTGKSIFTLCPEQEGCEFRQALDKMKQSGGGVRLDTQIKRRNGELVDVDITLSSIIDDAGNITAIVCNIRDITNYKQAIEAVRQSKAQLQGIMDHAGSVIYVKDTDGRYILANRQFEKLLSLNNGSIYGKTDFDLFPGDIAQGFQETDRVVLKNRIPMEFEDTTIQNGQNQVYLTNKFPLLDADGNIYGICGISTNITTRKEIETSLRIALEKEQEINELKTGFVSMVSHEFRTPLAVILATSDILLSYHDRLSKESREDKLSQIQHQVQRLTRMMNDVLLVNRADTIGISFKPEATPIVNLCEEVISDISLTYQNNTGIKFNHSGIDHLDNYMIDPELFLHILQNLLSNALKYSKDDSLVTVELYQSDNDLKLTVSDNGIGIPEAYQKHLFKSFERASNVGTIQGTGLGLSIVKRTVDAHNGTIEFVSTPGEGSTFTVTLPARKHIVKFESSMFVPE